MLSRLALQRCFQMKSAAPSIIGCLRLKSTVPQSEYDSPERDHVNFPRPVRAEFPSKVRYATIPEEWFEFFYKKTGVTGPYMFGLGVYTYVLSKEIWVIEHDYYFVYAFFILIYMANRLFGAKVANFLDKQVDLEEEEYNKKRNDDVQKCLDDVKREERSMWEADGQHLFIDAKRENVKVQLEATYRERAMQVYNEVKKRLDYQSEKDRIEQMIAHKHMVQWVVSNVLKSISPQQEKDNLKKCISDLQALSATV